MGYEWKYQTDSTTNFSYDQYLDYYQIDQVVIQNDQVIIDTLKNIKFDLIELNENKTRVDLINVELNRPGQIQDWKYLKRMSQFYQNQIHEGILKKVKTRE